MDSAKVQVTTVPTNMGDDLKLSEKSEKKHTSKIPVSAAQTLEILASVIESCRNTGINIQIVPLYDGGHVSTAIVLVDVKLIDGKLVK